MFVCASVAAMGGSYEFVKTASANLRTKEDHWNSVYGGFAAGSLVGFRGESFLPSSLELAGSIVF